MDILTQQLINGLVLGSIYALVALGHTVVDGGAIVLLGLLAAIAVCMVLGFLIERIAYRPLRRAPRLAALITAIGMSIVLQNLAMLIWGRQYITFPPLLPLVRYELAGAVITRSEE